MRFVGTILVNWFIYFIYLFTPRVVAYKCLIVSAATSPYLVSTFHCPIPDAVQRKVSRLNWPTWPPSEEYYFNTTVEFGNVSATVAADNGNNATTACAAVVFNGRRQYVNHFLHILGKREGLRQVIASIAIAEWLQIGRLNFYRNWWEQRRQIVSHIPRFILVNV